MVIDLRSETQYPGSIQNRSNLKYLRFPLDDGGIPNENKLNNLFYFVENQIELGHSVCFHCGEGIGRAPMVAIAYLIFKGTAPQLSINIVKRRRSLSNPNTRQLKWILAYSKSLE
jgi:protein-tyrosine phosphatase